jgi:hypothetical protein
MKKSLFFLRNIFIKGGKLVIINEFNALNIYQSHNYTIFKNWTPGILTNKVLLKSVIKANKLVLHVPSAALIIKPRLGNISFLREARSILLPNIGFVDSHFNHQLADYTVLTNFNKNLTYYYISILNILKQDINLNLSYFYLKKFTKKNLLKVGYKKRIKLKNKKFNYKSLLLKISSRNKRRIFSSLLKSFALSSFKLSIKSPKSKKTNKSKRIVYKKLTKILDSYNNNTFKRSQYKRYSKYRYLNIFSSYTSKIKNVMSYKSRLNKLCILKLKPVSKNHTTNFFYKKFLYKYNFNLLNNYYKNKPVKNYSKFNKRFVYNRNKQKRSRFFQKRYKNKKYNKNKFKFVKK